MLFDVPLAQEIRCAELTLAVGCAIMAAAGWWCQYVRYPAFRSYPPESFREMHARHTLQISPIVIPGMLLQLAGTGWLAILPTVPSGVKLVSMVLCLASIGPTLLVSGPIHGRLSGGKDLVLIEKLIRTNLSRTLIWSIQAVVSAAWLVTN